MANLQELISRNADERQIYKAEKQSEREQLSDMQDTGLCRITGDEHEYLSYLDLQAANPGISAGNLAIAREQNKDISVLASLDKWNRLGRSIMREQTGTKILMPEKYKDREGRTRTGYKVGRVFDIAQTTGRTLPVTRLADGTPAMEKALFALLTVAPVTVEAVTDFDARSTYLPDDRTILIRDGMSDHEIFAALSLEIAHAYLHDSGKNANYSREGYALDAESIGYMVCKRFGVACAPPATDKLLWSYSDMEATDRRTVLDSLQKASEHFGDRVERELSPPAKARTAREDEAR